MIWLAPGLGKALGGRPDMARIFNLPGRVYREPPGVHRRTLRFEAGGRGWFLKLHWGVGWGEIFKNLFSLRLPVLGAGHERCAIRRLEALGVETMTLAGYGHCGLSPARQRSFVITEELTDCISLEDFCAQWPENPPPPKLKWALIERLAQVSRRLLDNGVNHRDYYLCHFLLRQPWDGSPETLHLPLIDLHRVQIRRRTPERWRVKDIGSLWFSAMRIGLTRRDLLRFVRSYGGDLRQQLKDRQGFWAAVEARAQALDRTRPAPAGGPQKLELAAGAGTLTDLEPVRVLPGKRWVGRAQWRGKPVYAKLFQDQKRARVHHQRERDGLQALAEAGIPGPPILHDGSTQAEGWPLLLLAPIQPAQSLADAWPAWDQATRRHWLERMVDRFAEMHAAGLVQTDPHLDNFLQSADELYTLDGAGIDCFPAPVDGASAWDSLALLLAQLDPSCDAWASDLEIAYRQARGWLAESHPSDLARRIRAARERRWHDFQKKLWRDCTRFERREHPYGLQIVERALVDDALRDLLADPDASFPGPEQTLKNGNTCTVWAAWAGDRRVVIKRYNIKNFRHGLKLSLRRGRAFASWEAAQMLAFYGIPTPCPLALVRQRRGLLHPVAYFVTEYLPGPDARSWFRDPRVDWAEKQRMAAAIADLLAQLKAQRIAHGDQKATNFLIGSEGPVVIDLDALRRIPGHRFDRAWRRDMERFARNWADRPELANLFEEHLAGF